MSAICDPTSRFWTRGRDPPGEPLPPCLRDLARSGWDARSAGAIPKRIAVSSESPSVKPRTMPSTRISSAGRYQVGARMAKSLVPTCADQYPQRATQQCEDDALGEKLPHQTKPAGAERRPGRHLPVPVGGSTHEQAGDVAAGDQQEENGGTHEEVEIAP